MALLLGQEGEGSGSTNTIASEIAHTFKFKALATGKVTALHIKFNESGTATKLLLALQANEAGKPKEGVLAEGEITSSTAGEHEVTVAGVEVVSGTEYWLTLLPANGTCKYKKGVTTARRISATKHKLVTEEKSADWGVEESNGPVSIWATGTEGGSVVSGKATGVMLLTGTATGTTRAVVAGSATGPLLLGGTAKGTAAQRVEGKATGALLLTGTSTGGKRAVVSGSATGALLLTGTAKGQTAGGLAGKASGAMLLTGTGKGGKRAVVSGKATGALVLTGTATGSTKEGSPVTASATGTLRLTGLAKPHQETTTVVVLYPGLVNPLEQAGLVKPSQNAGLVNPLEKAGV